MCRGCSSSSSRSYSSGSSDGSRVVVVVVVRGASGGSDATTTTCRLLRNKSRSGKGWIMGRRKAVLRAIPTEAATKKGTNRDKSQDNKINCCDIIHHDDHENGLHAAAEQSRRDNPHHYHRWVVMEVVTFFVSNFCVV